MSEFKKALIPVNNLNALSQAKTGETPATCKPHLIRPFTPAGPSNSMSFMLQALRRWWKWAFPIGLLLGSGAAAVVFVLFKPSYEATSWLRIDAHQQFIAFETKWEDQGSSKIFVQTQIELIRSPLILGPVLSDPQIARMPEINEQPDPLQWLARQITVKQVGESELYRVSYATDDPKTAAKVVNAIVDEYFQIRRQEDSVQSEEVIKILVKERENRTRELKLLRESVRELAKQATGKDPFAGNLEPIAIINYPLAEIQNHMVTAEVEQEVLKARMKVFQDAAMQPNIVPDAIIEHKLDEHPAVLRAKEDIIMMRSQLRSLDSVTLRKEKDSAYNQLSREIRGAETALEKLCKDLRQKIREELQLEAIGKRDDQIAGLQTELDGRRIMVDTLRERYDKQLKDVKETSGDTMQLRLKQAELERAEKIDTLVAERIVKLRTEKGAPERVVLMKSAVPPGAPLEIFPYRKILLGMLAGFGLPFVLALAWEKMIRRVGDAVNLENESQLRVIGEIARIPSRPIGSRSRLPSRLGLELRMFEESIDSLRTTLMLEDDLLQVRILAVTSATNHEGKTSVAAQLALSLARATEKPILLIDGDIRSPDLQNIFDTPLEPGLTQVLEKKCSIEEAIIPIGKSNLDLLPAGKLENNPHQLLGNGSRDALRQAIPEKYRYVIIDTPPILAASEALMLATLADASLVCVLRDVSRIDQVKKAYDRLQNVGGRPIGLVLNGVPTKSYAYHYGSYAYTSKQDFLIEK